MADLRTSQLIAVSRELIKATENEREEMHQNIRESQKIIERSRELITRLDQTFCKEP